MGTDLKARLGRLRSHAAEPTSPAAATSLQQRLARIGQVRRKSQQPSSDTAVARLLDAKVVAEGLLEIERACRIPDLRCFKLNKTLHGALPDVQNDSADDWVFMDTETTGLAGGSGTLAFLVGMARPVDDVIIVKQFLMTRFAGEAAMLRRAAEWLGSAAFVSYNGKSFDAPLLSTRSRLARLSDWSANRPHLDLLYGVRRAFRNQWPDCRLATVEQRLLGLRRMNDLSGAEAPAAWLAHVRYGDGSRLAAVLDHNRQDLLSLVRLVPVLADVHDRPEAFDANVEAVAASWQQCGEDGRARALLERNRTRLCDAGLHRLAASYRRMRKWSLALGIWKQLAQRHDPVAIAHLAKYHEHVLHDARVAMAWTLQLPDSTDRAVRLGRLARKVAQLNRIPSAWPRTG